MATKDLYSHISPAVSLVPAARTASANGTGVDLQGFESAMVVIETGTVTDGTHTIDIQESDDNTTFTSVANADLQGTEPVINNTQGSKVFKVGYIGSKRYIRVAVTVSGATTGGVYGASIVRSHARHQPV